VGRHRSPSLGYAAGLVLAASLSLWPATASALAPASAETSSVANAPAQIDQSRLAQPATTPAAPQPDAAHTDSERRAPSGPSVGAGNAQMQSPDTKRADAKRSCNAAPAVNRLLTMGSATGSDAGGSWATVGLGVFVLATLVVGAAFAKRWWRAPRGQIAPRGALDNVSAVVAIVAAVATLAVQLVPGVAAHEHPSPQAGMQVRDVDPRITRGDYASALHIPQAPVPLDRREIGNVVWVQLHLEHYGGQDVNLQWGSYDLDNGEALIPGSANHLSIKVNHDSDDLSVFQPIWVGYPRNARFQVRFRLLDRGGLRELASTGPMKGALYRYACPSQS
jgi:hypothetical protein